MNKITIYTFYKYDNDGSIHISATSSIEAINTLCALNNYAKFIYDFKKFSKHKINTNDYCRILNIEQEYVLSPRFISDKEYIKLSNYFMCIDENKMENDKSNIQDTNSNLAGTEYKNIPSISIKQEKDYSEDNGLDFSNTNKVYNDSKMISISKTDQNNYNHSNDILNTLKQKMMED